MILRDHLDADQMRSLEDTMKSDFSGLAWKIGSNGNSSIDYADERPSLSGFSPGQDGNDVRTSTQPESLILAQSERWRQA